MTSLLRTGALLGFFAGVGLCLIWLGLPRHRRTGLAGRVLPYLRDTAPPSTLLQARQGSQGMFGVLAAPIVARAGGVVERVFSGGPSIRRRLERAGKTPDLERFRAEQVLWGVGGAFAGLVVSLLGFLTGSGSAIISVLVVLIGGVSGLVAKDNWLSHQAKAREERMLVEFPTIAELLALAVSAGEGTVGALERVTRLSRGELSDELRRCLADARAGASLPRALEGVAERTGLPSLSRFVDGIVIAVERGTPLAEVLRAQAQDVREGGRRAVMEDAGKREIFMMMPVVFLILPVTVLFAVYPGFALLNFNL